MKSTTIACLWILAVVMPVACVFVAGWLFWYSTHRTWVFMAEPGVTMTQALLVASPFVVLAWLATARLRTGTDSRPTGFLIAAASGTAVTAGLWGLYYYDGFVCWAEDQHYGVDFGLAALMCGSPLLVGAVMSVAYLISTSIAKRRSI